VKWKFLALVLLLGFSRPANSADTPEAVDVNGICGKLVSIENAAQPGTTNSPKQEAKPLEHVRIRLFSPSTDCCDMVTPLAETTTGRDGTFQFKKPEPGDYWVSATIGNKEYKVLVRLVPGKKGSTQCSAFLYVFEKGQLQLRRTETVTVN
jgi:hypothetical protein